jgi:hypothetical protein
MSNTPILNSMQIVRNLIENPNTTLEEVNNTSDTFLERLLYIEPILKNLKKNNLDKTEEFKTLYREYVEISVSSQIIEMCGTREADMNAGI